MRISKHYVYLSSPQVPSIKISRVIPLAVLQPSMVSEGALYIIQSLSLLSSSPSPFIRHHPSSSSLSASQEVNLWLSFGKLKVLRLPSRPTRCHTKCLTEVQYIVNRSSLPTLPFHTSLNNHQLEIDIYKLPLRGSVADLTIYMRTVNDTYSNLRTKQGVKSKINIVNLFGLMGLTGSHYEYSNYDLPTNTLNRISLGP